MNKREISTACKLLDSRTDRTEVIGLDTGGLALTAYWKSGGQRLFYTIEQVREYLDELLAMEAYRLALVDND